ncbi:MAG: RNA polymerase sigma factor [Balneolaceae bacterium]|nr:RNA polymerase sigma factor [Balneolaceae bacterium]
MNKNIAEKIYWKGVSTNEYREPSVADKFVDIIYGCREQDNNSQKELYKLYYGYAMGIALAYSISRDDALEVVNDSFMKVFNNIQSYNISEPFKPWFRKIVVNTAIDKARSGKRFNHHVDIETTENESSVNVEAELNAKQIYQLLNELPDLLRFVFNMYEIEGYSHREISQKLDIAESSSRTYLTRAKTHLRQLYKQVFLKESWNTIDKKT